MLALDAGEADGDASAVGATLAVVRGVDVGVSSKRPRRCATEGDGEAVGDGDDVAPVDAEVAPVVRPLRPSTLAKTKTFLMAIIRPRLSHLIQI